MFSSPFFVTIFTSTLQGQKSFDCWKLQRVWDHFLVYGWKAIFKVALLMMKTY